MHIYLSITTYQYQSLGVGWSPVEEYARYYCVDNQIANDLCQPGGFYPTD